MIMCLWFGSLDRGQVVDIKEVETSGNALGHLRSSVRFVEPQSLTPCLFTSSLLLPFMVLIRTEPMLSIVS